jgi:amino acid adenylation domain-containing protein
MSSRTEANLSSCHNLAAPFFRRVQTQPSRPALCIDGREISYGELGLQASRIARWLVDAGISRGARVGVLASRHPLAYAGILGTAWAGATYVPLNPKSPAARLIGLLERAQLSALIVDESGIESLSPELLESAPARVLAAHQAPERMARRAVDTQDVLLALPPLEQPVELQADDLAYLMFTSGTTGVPKGVMVTVGNVEHFLGVMQARYRIVPQDRLSQFFDLTFDLSVFDMFMAWSGGACLFPVSEIERLSPGNFIRKHALSVWFAVPSAIAFMLRVKALAPGAFPSLRLSLFCGEALPADSAARWREAAPNGVLENLYGPTEATVACLVEPCTETICATEGRGIVAIGAAFEGMTAAIVDSRRQFVSRGEVGELALSGPQISAGYWRDEELTREQLPVLHHPRIGRQVFYLTRDGAREDEHGRFHFLGRVDNQVKIHGHRVELEEIDAHLRALCGSEAAAVAWPVQHASADGVVAFVAGSELSSDEIQRAMKQLVPAYMVPRRIVRLEHLPLTANGKTDRAALARMLAS